MIGELCCWQASRTFSAIKKKPFGSNLNVCLLTRARVCVRVSLCTYLHRGRPLHVHGVNTSTEDRGYSHHGVTAIQCVCRKHLLRGVLVQYVRTFYWKVTAWDRQAAIFVVSTRWTDEFQNVAQIRVLVLCGYSTDVQGKVLEQYFHCTHWNKGWA